MDIAHAALWVSDLERAEEFYGALGLERQWSFEMGGAENVYLAADADGDALQLKYDPDRTTPVAPSRADVDHVAFTVEDVDEAFEAAIEAGGSALVEPTVVEEADAYVSFVEDPEGYTLELFQWR
jgi:lactoylglutathione lyase